MSFHPLKTLSDTLYECDVEIRQHQLQNPGLYGSLTARLDAIRAEMIAIRLELDHSPGDPPEWLACNPYYVAAMAGDPGPSDAYMDGDDTLREIWIDEIAKLHRGGEI